MAGERMDERTLTFERIWEVFQKYRTLLYHRAQRIAGNAELAEETLEEALVRVLGRWERVSGLTEPQILAYAAATVHNTAIDAARQTGRRQQTELPFSEEYGESISPQPSTEEGYLQRANREQVRRAMRRLTEDERQLVLQRYYLEYSYEQIGAQRGEKPDSVRVRLYRIRKKLLKLLKAEGYEHE